MFRSPNTTGLLGNCCPEKVGGFVTGWRVLPAFPSVQERTTTENVCLDLL